MVKISGLATGEPAKAAGTKTTAADRLFPFVGGAVFGVIGVVLNTTPISLGFGLDFLLGGVPAFVALRLWGLGAGCIAGALAATYSWVLWHHPYAIVIFTLEVLIAGLLIQRRHWPAVLAGVVYWMGPGLLLVFLFYRAVLGMDALSWWLVWEKQALNGLVKFILADLILIGLAAVRSSGRLFRPIRLDLRTVLLNALVLFTAVPVLTASVIDSSRALNHELADTKEQARHNLSLAFEFIAAELGHLDRELDKIGGAAATGENINRALAYLKRGHGDASFGAIAELRGGRLLSMRASSPYWQGRAEALPALLSALPGAGRGAVLVRGPGFRVEGAVLIWKELGVASGKRDVLIILTSPDYLLSRLTAEDATQPVVMRFDLASKPATSEHSTILAELAPRDAEPRWRLGVDIPPIAGSLMTRWMAGTVWAAGDLTRGGALRLVASLPLRPLVEWHRVNLVTVLGISLVLIVIAVVAGSALSVWVVRPLQLISARAADLPSQIIRTEPIAFPPSAVAEVDELALSLSSTANAIVQQVREISAYRSRLEGIIVNAPVVVFSLRVVGEKNGELELGGISYASPSFERIFGFSSMELESAPLAFRNRVHPDDMPVIHETSRRLPVANHVNREYRIRTTTGEYRWVHSELNLVRDEAGKATEVIGFAYDIQDERDAKAQLMQSAKMATVGQLATGLAHELNQPLNVIGMIAHNTRARLDRGDIERTLLIDRIDRIESQVNRAAAIIDHMRIFGRSSHDRAHPFRLNEAIDGVLLLTGRQAAVQAIDIAVDYECDDFVVHGVPQMLEQVFLNLLVNATQAISERRAGYAATPADGCDRISISVRRTERGGRPAAEISVEDSGTGIPEARLDRVFEPFFTTKEPGMGTGLGLSVSYGIVADMGGTIEASNGKKGAVFTVILPLSDQVPVTTPSYSERRALG